MLGAMSTRGSALDSDAVARARLLLETAPPPVRIWPMLTAAACLALTALVLAGAMVLAPPLTSEPVAPARSVN
jgi:hypothetical protein